MDRTNSPTRRDSAFSEQQQTTAVPWTHSSVAQDVLSVFSTRPPSSPPPSYSEINPPPPRRNQSFPQTLFHAWILVFKHFRENPYFWVVVILVTIFFLLIRLWFLPNKPFVVLYVIQTLCRSAVNSTPQQITQFNNDTSTLSRFLIRVLRTSLYQLQKHGYFNQSLFYVTATD